MTLRMDQHFELRMKDVAADLTKMLPLQRLSLTEKGLKSWTAQFCSMMKELPKSRKGCHVYWAWDD